MQLKFAVRMFLLGGAFCATAVTAGNDPATPSVAVVNGTPIPAIYAQVLRQERAARGQAPAEITEEQLRQLLVTVEVQAQAAQQKGLDKPETVRAILELQRKESLVKLLQEDFIRTHQIPDELIRSQYDQLKARTGDTEYHVRHILVEDEKSAKDLIAKLTGKKKAKFEDLAKDNSRDGSAKEGGDLGWINPNSVVPEFAGAMRELKKGEVTPKPVQTRVGWHIIKLEESRKIDFPEYEKAKERIAAELLQIEYRKYVEELKAAAKVEVPAK